MYLFEIIIGTDHIICRPIVTAHTPDPAPGLRTHTDAYPITITIRDAENRQLIYHIEHEGILYHMVKPDLLNGTIQMDAEYKILFDGLRGVVGSLHKDVTKYAIITCQFNNETANNHNTIKFTQITSPIEQVSSYIDLDHIMLFRNANHEIIICKYVGVVLYFGVFSDDILEFREYYMIFAHRQYVAILKGKILRDLDDEHKILTDLRTV
jgi:hypothetical protein